MTSSLSRRFRRAESADEDEVTGRLCGSDPRRADGPALVLQQDHADAVTFPIYAAEGWPARINVRRHPQPRDGLVFKLIRIGDTLNLIDPDTLPHRLDAADMVGPQVQVGARSFR
jgi:hypothetical protein